MDRRANEQEKLMKTFLGVLAFASISASCFAAEAGALRARALELGGGLRNEEFIARDASWSGKLDPGSPRSLAVNLFAGNRYVFCAAAPADRPGPKLLVRDAEGKVAATAGQESPGFSVVAVTPGASGRYFVEAECADKSPTEFCLVYFFR